MLTTEAVWKAMEHISLAQTFLAESRDPRLPAVVEALDEQKHALSAIYEAARGKDN